MSGHFIKVMPGNETWATLSIMPETFLLFPSLVGYVSVSSLLDTNTQAHTQTVHPPSSNFLNGFKVLKTKARKDYLWKSSEVKETNGLVINLELKEEKYNIYKR